MPQPQHSIPSKQRHYAGTLAELQGNLLWREIGFCTDDNKCYIKDEQGVLHALGDGGSVNPPSDTTKNYAYTFPANGSAGAWALLKKDPVGSGSSQTAALWTEMGGSKFAAERALKDEQGRSIKDAITTLANKADKSSVASGTYTKVTVNGEGIVIAGANLAVSDVPDLPASKIAGGHLDPDRLEDGSVPVAKMEAKKQLAVDGTTMTASETGSQVVLSAIVGDKRLHKFGSPVAKTATLTADDITAGYKDITYSFTGMVPDTMYSYVGLFGTWDINYSAGTVATYVSSAAFYLSRSSAPSNDVLMFTDTTPAHEEHKDWALHMGLTSDRDAVRVRVNLTASALAGHTITLFSGGVLVF